MSAECHKCGSDIVYPGATWPIGECPRCTRDGRIKELEARLAAFEALTEAAAPMANLPWPLSSDERQEWIVNQNRLRDALRVVEGKPETACPDCDGIGHQAGAHTERLIDCPTCDGTGAA